MGNANLVAPPTESQLLGLQVSRTVASIPSILGATFIVQHVLRSPKRRRRTVTRIMFGMSLMDLLFACVLACTSSVVPKEMSRFIVLARGTWATCEAAGFLEQGARLSSVLYNAALTMYYLLTIRYGWSETRIRGMEPFLHLIPLTVGWTTAVVGLLYDQYNPTLVGCDIVEFPRHCMDRDNCIRGENADIFNLTLLLGWVWLVFVVLVLAMTMIYLKIAQVDASAPASEEYKFQQASNGSQRSTSKGQAEQYPSSGTSSVEIRGKSAEGRSKRTTTTSTHRSLTRLKKQFAMQALLYCMAFVVTWAFPTLGWILLNLFSHLPPYTPIMFLTCILTPFQGFWNAFIYVRPRYLRYRRQQKEQREIGLSHQGRSILLAPRSAFQAYAQALSVDAGAEQEEEDLDDVLGDEPAEQKM